MSGAIQDSYADKFSHCYGCGRNNPAGHKLKSYLEGDRTLARFTPSRELTGGVPDNVYGGLIASLLDCHGAASAAAFAAREMGVSLDDSEEPVRFVTASLKVDYLRPTPIETELLLTGKLRTIEGRKVWVDMTLEANGEICAKAEMLAVRFRD